MYTVGRRLFFSRSSVVLRGDCEVACWWYYIFHYHMVIYEIGIVILYCTRRFRGPEAKS